MATIVSSTSTALQRERRFFFFMALALAAITVAGFLRYIFLGYSNFGEPLWVSAHGVTMMGWLGLFVVQNGLVAQGNLALHRRLGVLTAGWSVLVLLMGAMVLAMNTAQHRSPPGFGAAYLITLDACAAFAFAGLTWTGVALRRRSDWHKRLILGGTICIIAPGLGRFVPEALVDTRIAYVLFPAHLFFFVVAMAYDLRTRGRIHPAYFWGVGALVAMTLLPSWLASTAPLTALVHSLAG